MSDAERILIADVDDVSIQLLSFALRNEGFDILVARSGLDALHLAREEIVHAILAEVDLPDIDGIELCRRLQADWRSCLIPVVLTTSFGGFEERVLGLSAGADDFLIRPYDLRELVVKLRRLIASRSKCYHLHPLTQLPTGALVRNYIEQTCLSGGYEDWALLEIDINNFRAYNRLYGYAAGDRVLSAMGRLLRETTYGTGTDYAFAGHMDRDDFVAIVARSDTDRVCSELVARFDALMPGWYPEEHRPLVLAPTRRSDSGMLIPRLALSIGVVTGDLCEHLNYLELVEACADMRDQAKLHESSFVQINTRRLRPYRGFAQAAG
jgi:DNA-binding response OmpR family regulator